MVRRRRNPVIVEVDEDLDDRDLEEVNNNGQNNSSANTTMQGPMYTIMSNVQKGETLHKKYIKEMQRLYEQMDHDAFMFTLIKLLKTPMVADECNEYAYTTLIFCAKFISSFDSEDTHPIVTDIFKWLLSTISNNSHIRFRLCQFVNMVLNALGPEAALDDRICDSILEYMLQRLSDTSPNVRLQAVFAMQRLQVPDNPDDPVLRAYQYHLCSDPSPKVRQAVITCMGRNFNTIPYILERLWDIDEKVRRHTYVHMSSYSVRSYKVAQRLTLLEQGLNDRSEGVRKVVSTILINQWMESYQKNLITLTAALKLDASEKEIDRFRKITKQMLMEIFKRHPIDDSIMCLTLIEEGEFHRCIPHEDLKIENAFYWECLHEYMTATENDNLDYIVPELTVMCNYVQKYCETQYTTADKFEQLEFTFKLLSLMNILYRFDLSDINGRNRLKELLEYLLLNNTFDQRLIVVIVKCAENLIEDQNERIDFFVKIIRTKCDLHPKANNLINDRSLMEELQANCSDADKIKMSALKVKFLELEDQETDFLKEKNYVQAQMVSEAKNATLEEFSKLLEKYCHQNDKVKSSLALSRPVNYETILNCLQLAYNMIVSNKVKTLNTTALQLYNDFICRHLASNQFIVRDWALKCGTAYSMLYEALAKDVFDELYSQFFKNHNILLWETSITCIFELLDRYGVDKFVDAEDGTKTKKTTGRQLYNTLESIDDDDERGNSIAGQGVGVIYMMSHFLDTCDDISIVRAIIIGFCRLFLRRHLTNPEIVEKLLLRYFNPTTDPEISQMLGIFMENVIEQRNFAMLQVSLLPTLSAVLSAPYESPLHDIKPENITRFFIDFTRQDMTKGRDKLHNKIALSFLQEMFNNVNNKDLCKQLAKELLTLELDVQYCEDLKAEMKEIADKLIQFEFDARTIKNIINFKDLMDGKFCPQIARPNDGEETDNDDDDDDDNESAVNSERDTAASVTSETSEAFSIESTKHLEDQLASNKSPNRETEPTTQSTMRTPGRTTYGENNSTIHNSLRKSLSLSLTIRRGNGRRTLLNTTLSPRSAKKTRPRAKGNANETDEDDADAEDKEKEDERKKAEKEANVAKESQEVQLRPGASRRPKPKAKANPETRKENESNNKSPAKRIGSRRQNAEVTRSGGGRSQRNLALDEGASSSKISDDVEVELTNNNSNENATIPVIQVSTADEQQDSANDQHLNKSNNENQDKVEANKSPALSNNLTASPSPKSPKTPSKQLRGKTTRRQKSIADPKQQPEPQPEPEPKETILDKSLDVSIIPPSQTPSSALEQRRSIRNRSRSKQRLNQSEIEQELEIQISASSSSSEEENDEEHNPAQSSKNLSSSLINHPSIIVSHLSGVSDSNSVSSSHRQDDSQSPNSSKENLSNTKNNSDNKSAKDKPLTISKTQQSKEDQQNMKELQRNSISSTPIARQKSSSQPSSSLTLRTRNKTLTTPTTTPNTKNQNKIKQKEKEKNKDKDKGKQQRDHQKKKVDDENNSQNFDDSDVIPASPQEDTIQTLEAPILKTASIRLRRALLVNSSTASVEGAANATATATRSLRNRHVTPGKNTNLNNTSNNNRNTTPVAAAAAVATKTHLNNTTKNDSSSSSSLNSASHLPTPTTSTKSPTSTESSKTPVRNGRKRLRLNSPHPVTSNASPSASTRAPPSSAIRAASVAQDSPIRKQSRLADINSNAKQNKSLTLDRESTTIIDGSPTSSLKENENPTNQKKQTLNSSSSAKATELENKKTKTPSPSVNKVTTRNSARKESQANRIVTRKRLSTELNRSARSPDLQPQRKKIKVSKIPINSKRFNTTTGTTTTTKQTTSGSKEQHRHSSSQISRNSSSSLTSTASKSAQPPSHSSLPPASLSHSTNPQKSKIVIIASIDSNKKNPPSRLPLPFYRRSRDRN